MKQYLKILKNDNSSLSLGPTVVTVGHLYEVTGVDSSYHIKTEEYTGWCVNKEQEGEYYIIVGEFNNTSLIGV